jgi:hypothetical protein
MHSVSCHGAQIPALGFGTYPLDDISLMKQVSFVMKEGVVYKMNSAPVPVS